MEKQKYRGVLFLACLGFVFLAGMVASADGLPAADEEGEGGNRGQISFVTVFVPMPAGTKTIPVLPAKASLGQDNAHASVVLGDYTYQFGKIEGGVEAMVRVTGRDASGKPYQAAALRVNGKTSQNEQ